MMDLPAAAMATLGLFALWRSDGLTRRGPSAAAGALLGLTLLTKTLASVFFVGPLLAAAGRSMRLRRARPALEGAVLFGAAAALVAAAWYVPNARDIARYVTDFGFGEGAEPFRAGGPALLSLRNLGYYAFVLANQGLGLLPSAAFAVVALASVLGRRESTRAGTSLPAFLWAWLIGAYAILTVLPNKGGERYVLGLLPPVAIMLARLVCGLEGRRRSALIGVVIAAGALNAAVLTWETPLAPLTHGHFDGFPHTEPLPRGAARGWPVAAVMTSLERITPPRVSSRLEASTTPRSYGPRIGASCAATRTPGASRTIATRSREARWHARESSEASSSRTSFERVR
jgi:hypothetical protein